MLLSFVIIAAPALALACGYEASTGYDSPTPSTDGAVAAVAISIKRGTLEVGQITQVTANAVDGRGIRIDAPIDYHSTSPRVAGVNSLTGEILAVSPGTTQIVAASGGSTANRTLTVAPSSVTISEIRPGGVTPEPFVELFNPTAFAVDATDWMLETNDPLLSLTLRPGAIIPPFGYLVVREQSFFDELKAADVLKLVGRERVSIDEVSWTQATATSYARCEEGVGRITESLVATPGDSNLCSASSDAAVLMAGAPR